MIVVPGGAAGGGSAENGVSQVDSNAALRATDRVSLGTDLVNVLGYATPGDRGGGLFRFVSTGQPLTDDDDGTVIVTTGGAADKWVREDWENGQEVNVCWFGVLPDGSDSSARLVNILNTQPDSPLFWPQGSPNDRYRISVDVNADPGIDRAQQEANLQKGNRSASQAADWAYAPKWRGEAPLGEPEESGTIIAIADSVTKQYAVRVSKPGPQISAHGTFTAIRFWGDTGNTAVGNIVELEDAGHFTSFVGCKFRNADVGVKLIGVFNCRFLDCVLGDRNNQGLNVGVWQVASGDSYAGWQRFEDTTISVDVCGVLSNNQANFNPSIGDRYVNCEFENNKGLAAYLIHTGYNWNPTQFESNYMENINQDTGKTYPFAWDYSRYGVPDITTNEGEAFRLVGRGICHFRDLNHLIHLQNNPAVAGPNVGDDNDGPSVLITHNRYPGSHETDDDSELVITNNYVFGPDGGVDNESALRVYTINDNSNVHACSRMWGHFRTLDDQTVNNFEGAYDLSKFALDGAGTKQFIYDDTPTDGPSVEIDLQPGEEVQILGDVGGVNYLPGAESIASYNAFTFAIRAVTAQPLLLDIKNSLRALPFSQPIELENDAWHSYAIVTNRGSNGGYHYSLINPGGSPVTFRIGDIQHVNYTDRQLLREYLDGRRLASAISGGGQIRVTESIVDGARDFGIRGDRSDESDALEAAINAISDGGPAQLHLPQGVIRITRQIDTTRLRGCTIEGVGKLGGWFAAPWTLNNTGGTAIEWAGPAGGTMWSITESRFFKLSGLTLATQLMEQTGDSAAIAIDIPGTPAYGDGHIDLASCSFALSDGAVGMNFGTVPLTTNAADLKAHQCTWWGDAATSAEIGVRVNHIQGVNYTFVQCVMVYLDIGVECLEGGNVDFSMIDTFNLRTLIKSVNVGQNNGGFSVQGMRADRGDPIPLTLFDFSEGNAEPKMGNASEVVVISNPTIEGQLATADPLVKAKDNVRVLLDTVDARSVPLVRFYGSTKTGITPSIRVNNIELNPGLTQDKYFGTNGAGVSTGELVQMDNANPGFGSVTLENVFRLQRPEASWSVGVGPDTAIDPEPFQQWLIDTFGINMPALWMFNEPLGSTEVINYGAAGGSFTVDSTILGHDGGVPFRTGADWTLRTTPGFVDTGLDITTSTTSYTFFMLLKTLQTPPTDSSSFFVASDDQGTLNSDNYLSFPYLPSPANSDLTVIDNIGGASPTTTSITNQNQAGWFPLVATYDQPTGEVDFYLGGQHVKENNWPKVLPAWNMPGNARCYVGGFRLTPAPIRDWDGGNGLVGILNIKLGAMEAIELSTRMTAASKNTYAHATTP